MSIMRVKKVVDAVDPILIKDGVVKNAEEYDQLMDAVAEKVRKFKESQNSSIKVLKRKSNK